MIKSDNSLEFDLMLRILKADEMPTDIDEEYISSLDWDKWVGVIKRHGVFTQIYKKIKKYKPDLVPSRIKEILRESYYKNLSINLSMCSGLSRFQNDLELKGIRSLIFKGPVTSHFAYGDYALRSYQDVDLLIEWENFNRLYEKIESDGYRIFFRMSKMMRFFWAKLGREYTFAKHRKIFDLHFRIQRGPKFRSSGKELFSEVKEISIENTKIKGLSVEMSLISICINATKDGWTRMVNLIDFKNITNNYPETDWGKIIFFAKSMKVYSLVLITLLLAEKLLGMKIPPGISSKDLRKKRIKSFSERYEMNLREGYSKKKRGLYQRLEIMAIDTLWGRFRYLLYYVFVPKMSDVQNLKIPGILFPLLILLRPLFLFFRMVRTDKVVKGAGG